MPTTFGTSHSFSPDPDGTLTIRDAVFDGKHWDSLELHAPGLVTVERVLFRKCTVSPGIVRFRRNSVIRDVTFDHCKLGAFMVARGIEVRNLTIIGGVNVFSMNEVYRRPFGKRVSVCLPESGLVLDVSACRGPIDVRGVPPSMLRLNGTTHYVMNADAYLSRPDIVGRLKER